MTPSAPLVLSLDDPSAVDVARSGSKGAGLARARALGLPVLEGFVISPEVSVRAFEMAEEVLEKRGSGGARMSIISAEISDLVLTEIGEAAAELPQPVIVRSSSVLEGSGEWSGAFTSIPEVFHDEIPKATKSVWATNFALEVLERFEAAELEPTSAPMGVLVQPEILPEFGGAARVDAHGVITINAVKGSPRDLMAGWESGVRAVFEDGSISGADAVELMGEAHLCSIVELATTVAEQLDHNLIEWAIHDGQPVLLQIQRSAEAADGSSFIVPAALSHPFAKKFIRLAHQYPGSLGEELVLSWLPGLRRSHRPLRVSTGATPSNEILQQAQELSAKLTSQAWGLPADEAYAQARSVLRRLRSDRPNESIEVLSELQEVDIEDAERLLGLVEFLMATQVRPQRVGIDRWEPVLAGVVALQGEVHTGVPSVGGIGAGRLVWVENSKQTDHVRPRDIIVTQYPLQNISPLLWDAAGVITLGGAPTAHLFEVARSLTVPAVVDCPIGDIVRSGTYLGMIDGDSGRVAILKE